MTTGNYAVIDIGTLKVKCQIVQKKANGKFTTLYQSNNLTCLGCGMAENNNQPTKKNLAKTIKELAACKKIIEHHKVTKMRIVSTHALREMGKVGLGIAKLIKKKVGFNIEIISQQEEAELFFKAVTKDFTSHKNYIIADIGGGSVQILIGKKNKLHKSFLLKTGTSTLWDKFTASHQAMDFPTRAEIRKMTTYIMHQLQPIPQGIKTPVIYGSSCIIDLFQNINLPLQTHTSSKSHPYKVKVSDMEKFLKDIWPIPYDLREQKYTSPTYRYMWGIDKAFLNILQLAKKVDAPYVIPSNANINQGFLMSIAS